MHRLFAVLFLSSLLAASTVVHFSLLGSRPWLRPEQGVATGASAGVTFASTGNPGLTVPIAYAVAKVAAAAPAPDPPPAAPLPSRTLSTEDTVYDLRGQWRVEWGRGAVARIDGDPVPRSSAVVPILMYHNVRPIDFKTTNAFVSDLTLPPAELELQLRYLKERGFSSVSLLDLALHFQGRKDLPPYPVILTFDDGYRNNYDYAYPLLRRYGYTATFFIITGLVGQTDYMYWGQVQEMANAGMEIGSHTVSHVDLGKSAPAVRDRELTEAKRILQQSLGISMQALSYPSGAYNAKAVVAARKAGYSVAVTTEYGATHDGAKPMELSRVRIHGTDTLPVFRWRIEQYFPVGGPSTR